MNKPQKPVIRGKKTGKRAPKKSVDMESTLSDN